MAITLVQVGTPGATTGTLGPCTATLAAPATAGNLLIFAFSISTGFAHAIPPAGWVQGGVSADGPPSCAVYYKVAEGGETTVTLNSDQVAGLDCQVYEFATGGLTLRPDVSAGVPFSVPAMAATATTPPCSRSGLALGVTVWKGSNALTGFAAAGWTTVASGQGARGYQMLTTSGGVTTLAAAATWTPNRTGEGFVLLFTPKAAFRPSVSIVI